MVVDDYRVIGLSGRQERLDQVLFTLLHEVSHILLEHVDASHHIFEEVRFKSNHEAHREWKPTGCHGAAVPNRVPNLLVEVDRF